MTSLALTPQQRSAVEQFESQSPWLSLSVWELMANSIAQAAPHHELLRGSWAFKGLPPEQIDLHNQIGAAGGGLMALDGIRAAVCVRATSADFSEVALRWSLGARFAWLQTQVNVNNHPDELCRTLLQAAAANDSRLISQIMATPSSSLEKPNNRDYALILQSLIALLRNDGAEIARMTAAMSKRRPKAYVKAIQVAVIAIANRDSAGFTKAVSQMLEAFSAYMFSDPLLSLIDPHAIGLVRLCELHWPAVLESFCRSQGLPWDEAYSTWLQTADDAQTWHHSERTPESIRPYVCGPTPLAWGKSFRQTVLANQQSPPKPF